MKPGRYGVWYAADKLTPAEWRTLLAAVEELGYETLWHSESRHYEAMALGSFMLANTSRLNIGTSIANIYARDAVSSVNGMNTLNEVSGGRYVLGLGVSHKPLVERMRGHSYGKPVATMREYLTSMREHAGADADWPVAIAALGPRMLALAAELASGALPYNATPEHTARARAILGEDRWLVAEQKVCLESDPATARALARLELERYLALPAYCDHWLRIGFTQDDLSAGGSDRFLDAMVVWGSVEDIQGRLREHQDAGATQVCIQPVHPAGDVAAAIRTLKALAPSPG